MHAIWSDELLSIFTAKEKKSYTIRLGERYMEVFFDLDYLAGTWTDEEKQEFDENVKFFECIDEELWLSGGIDREIST